MTRVAVIGYGAWGKNIVRTLQGFPEVSVSIVTREEAPPEDIDGVIIATPSATHAEIALPFVERGIPTFIEKPMATSLSDAERLVEAAQKFGAPIFVGHVHLYNPAFIKLLELLPEIGTLRLVVSESMGGEARTDSSVLWDWLPHEISMALRICKEPVSEVQAWGLRGETKAYSSVTAKYLFGDIPFVSTASWTGLYKRRCTLITGEVGTILFDDRAEKKLTLFKKDGMSYPSYSDELPLVSEMTAFLQMIRSKVVDASQLQTGLAVVRLIACAEASAQNGGKSVSC